MRHGTASAAATSRPPRWPGPGRCSPTGPTRIPELMSLSLNDKAPVEHGVQCCGGEVTILLEPLAVVPSVAIFGLGHVGLELARILARHDVELHLVDSRAEQASDRALAGATRRRPGPRPRPPRARTRAGPRPGPAGHPRARHDARPRRGHRPVRRRAALLAPRLDRPDRLVGQVVPVPVKLAEEGHGPTRSPGSPRPSACRTSPARTPPPSRSAWPPTCVRTFERDRAPTHTEVAR